MKNNYEKCVVWEGQATEGQESKIGGRWSCLWAKLPQEVGQGQGWTEEQARHKYIEKNI